MTEIANAEMATACNDAVADQAFHEAALKIVASQQRHAVREAARAAALASQARTAKLLGSGLLREPVKRFLLAEIGRHGDRGATLREMLRTRLSSLPLQVLHDLLAEVEASGDAAYLELTTGGRIRRCWVAREHVASASARGW